MNLLRKQTLFPLIVSASLLIGAGNSRASGSGIIHVDDHIDTKSFGNSQYLEYFRLKEPHFTFSIDNVETHNSYTKTEVSFPSEFISDQPENNTVYLSYYRPSGVDNVPCAIILGNLRGRYIMARAVARALIERDIASVIIQLPYFGKRSATMYDDLLAECENSKLITDACVQSVLDIKRTRHWLRNRPEIDPDHIGIFGISYGAIIGAIAIGVEPGFGPNVLIAGGGDVARILWESSRTAKMKSNLEQNGYTLQKLRAELKMIDPLTYASRINPDKLIMFNGKNDNIIPSACTRMFWEKAGKPEMVWLKLGHITALLQADKILRNAADAFAATANAPPQAAGARAIWVECEGENSTLSSKQKIVEMLDTVSDAGFNTVFVQVYRGNRAWFLSDIADTAPFQKVRLADEIDLLQFIIDEGDKRGLEIHAWLNIFRIARNRRAKMLQQLGKEIVIVDSKGRSLLDYPGYSLPAPESDYFTSSDESLMLDPGSPEVQKYQLGIIRELIEKYPGIDGVHLDFVRYPYTVPYPPGSRYSKAIDFGYNRDTLVRFKNETGLAPPLSKNFNNTREWDNWRRSNVTDFIEKTHNLLKKQSPSIKLSTAVLCWADRAYLAAFQDWRGWLQNKLVDFVVPMNYTRDRTFAYYISRTSVNFSAEPPAYIGLQAYMGGTTNEEILAQIDDCIALGARGIVLFSYDSILRSRPGLFNSLKQGPFKTSSQISR